MEILFYLNCLFKPPWTHGADCLHNLSGGLPSLSHLLLLDNLQFRGNDHSRWGQCTKRSLAHYYYSHGWFSDPICIDWSQHCVEGFLPINLGHWKCFVFRVPITTHFHIPLLFVDDCPSRLSMMGFACFGSILGISVRASSFDGPYRLSEWSLPSSIYPCKYATDFLPGNRTLHWLFVFSCVQEGHFSVGKVLLMVVPP